MVLRYEPYLKLPLEQQLEYCPAKPYPPIKCRPGYGVSISLPSVLGVLKHVSYWHGSIPQFRGGDLTGKPLSVTIPHRLPGTS
jgi:hypothetical protein